MGSRERASARFVTATRRRLTPKSTARPLEGATEHAAQSTRSSANADARISELIRWPSFGGLPRPTHRLPVYATHDALGSSLLPSLVGDLSQSAQSRDLDCAATVEEPEVNGHVN